ncbi:protein LplB [Anaerocolumna cellulosilytica]|uniref:Protein LplB n=1 Tax=Anaerocolumna cellulosilytica TaxID=433286 RepID=A0A6S6QYX6_9FIRM|nr:ABC transporter permease subunit [Anaerocolumna cellulosilytica]MBB5196386.1 putative aldouronate transport system permease protein [Anaerocolumna cellulosilytica]BCJ96413.1 protein LplB [Anaerocolumna cellulosilytica]
MARKTTAISAIPTKKVPLKKRLYKYRYFYVMFIPVFLLFMIFNYIPMIGIFISFFDWGLFGANEFVGLDNFKALFSSNLFWRAFRNTLFLSFVNLILSMIFSVGLAVILDDLIGKKFKKFAQTVLYIPHFLSWVVVASIFTMFLSPQDGVINKVIEAFGGDSIYFMVDKNWWTVIFLLINRWKETGWGTIIFIAALTGVDQEMYEAAKIDGATRIQRILYITLPSIQNTILVVFVLNLAKVLNIFEPIFVLYNSSVLSVSDVIGTYVYRMGIINQDYGMSTAAGLFKSVVSLVLVSMSNRISKKVKGEGII